MNKTEKSVYSHMYTLERSQKGELLLIILTRGVKHSEGWLPVTPRHTCVILGPWDSGT